MSKFKKLLFTLIFILIIEILLIYIGYKNSNEDTVYIKNYNSKKPVALVVDITSNELFVLQNNNLIKTYPIASGKQETPSPIGNWKIISKDTWGKGFGGHWMGLNVPWGKYGIHGTIFPNSIGARSSHGCIRMRNSDVAELYKIARHGTPIIIYGGPYGNFGEYLRPLKPGMNGSDVYEVQKLLKDKGYYKGNPDGIYSKWMRSAVHKFQKDNKLTVSDTISWNFYNKLGVELRD